MRSTLERALAFVLFCVPVVTFAHEHPLGFLSANLDAVKPECHDDFVEPRAKLYIPDAELLLKEPYLLERLGSSRVLLGGWVLEELDAAGDDEELAPAVEIFKGTLRRALALPVDQRRVRIDNLSYVKELTDTGLDRTKSNTKLLALALHHADEQPIILSGNAFLMANAQSLAIPTEHYDVANPLTDPDAKDLFPYTITDEEMRTFQDTRSLPMPPDFDREPNQFIQYSSPGTPAGKNTVGRFIYERPKLIKAKFSVVENRLEFAANLIPTAFVDTIRVKMNGELVPRLDQNPKHDGGWQYDGDGTITFTGSRYVPGRDSAFEIFVQQRPHRIEALKTYREMDAPGREASFEQLMLMNLMMDPSIDGVIVVGVAGASKTYSAATAALTIQKHDPRMKVLATRVPAHVGARDPGAVPGGLKEKAAPWILALINNIGQILGREVKDLPPGWTNLEFSYLRGQSLTDSLVIFDEAQNSTKDLMKTVVTRIGRNSRIFIMGDVTQVDANQTLRLSVNQNGLAAAVALYRMPNLSREEKSRVAIIRMRKTVRSDWASFSARIFEDPSPAAP